MNEEICSIVCPICGETCETDQKIETGMRLQCPFCEGHFYFGVSSAEDIVDAEVCRSRELDECISSQQDVAPRNKTGRIMMKGIKNKVILIASLSVGIVLIAICCVFGFRNKPVATSAIHAKEVSSGIIALPKDESESKSLYQKGLRYLTGDIYTKKDVRRGAEMIERAAKMGLADAQNEIAVCYALGQGVLKDTDEAIKWFRKSAEQGCVKAQRNLALRYESGNGVRRDLGEAVKWFRKAAERGDADSQNELGVCYLRGEGVAKDYDEAVKWFRKASEEPWTHALAQCNLGLCLKNDWGYSGLGDQDRKKEAVKMFWNSANQGCAEAQFELGECYREGKLIGHDLEEALKWYVMSAKQGYVKAQSILGFLYLRGYGRKIGESPKYDEGVMWLKKAADQGDHAAMGKLDELGIKY